MSIYLDEKNPEKHKPFDDASPDIVAYVRYLEVLILCCFGGILRIEEME